MTLPAAVEEFINSPERATFALADAYRVAVWLMEEVCASCGRSLLTMGCLDDDSHLGVHSAPITRSEFLRREGR